VQTALDTALELGYRHIDTAWVYENESAIGQVLKKWLSSGKLAREDLFVTTKLPMVGVHPDRVETFMKKSLENLQLDYVDLYLIHFPVGCKYEEGAVRPLINENGEVETEPKTDHAALWQVIKTQLKLHFFFNCFTSFLFVENGRTSRCRKSQEYWFIQL
jgi:alcohol dehydrogenase (NADP+)